MFIDNETKLRVNIFAPYKGYSILDTSEIRAACNVVEIPDPVQPEDYSEGTYYRTEQDTEPYVVYTKKSNEQIREYKLSLIPKVSPRQFRQQLLAMDLLDTVEAAVAAGDRATKIWWEFATEFERTNPQVIAMATQLQVTEEQLDQVFIEAAKL